MRTEIHAHQDVHAALESWSIPAAEEKEAAALPKLITAAELYQARIAAARCLIKDLLWDGLTLFIAKPKAGKSWFTLELAVQVAGGRAITGVTANESGPVLYGALEEPASRSMARLRQVAPSGEWANRLHVFYELLPFMGGGAEQLEALVRQIQPRLIVLDTLTALLKGGSKRDSDVFRSQYAEVRRIGKLAENFKTAIVVVHHARKGASDSAIEAIAGTGGIGAAIDAIWYLKRKPEGEATLEVLGREVEEKTFALSFSAEPENFGWSVLGDDAMQLLNSERRQILELLQDDGGLTPAQIAMELAKSRPGIRQLLKRMRIDGQVFKQGSKYFPSLTVSHRVTERESD